MKTAQSLLLGIILGFAAYYTFDYNRATNQQIQVLKMQATIEALLPLCPEVFRNVVKEQPKAGK